MDCSSGAGSRLIDSFNRGQMAFLEDESAFRDVRTNQEYTVTDEKRIVRFDPETKQQNVYNHETKEFWPVSSLQAGERQQRYGDAQTMVLDMFHQPSLADKLSQVAMDAGKYAAYGAGGAVLSMGLPVVIHALERPIANAAQNAAHAATLHRSELITVVAAAGTVAASQSLPTAIAPRHFPRLRALVTTLAAVGGGTVGGVVGGFAIGGPLGAVIGGTVATGTFSAFELFAA